ncbi:hypothetical protein, partial [Sphingomonas sp. Ant20]|uniref:hypothetical protein n=1 Tax=Sphingomonas sp. Ant20 TaxID=104605 RepID=UPI0018E341DC
PQSRRAGRHGRCRTRGVRRRPLPPSLGISASAPAPATDASADGAAAEKPRRRRVRVATDEVEAG